MRTLLGTVVVASSMALSTAAWAQAKQDFTLINETGYALGEIYVAPSRSDNWEEDILGVMSWTVVSRSTFHSIAPTSDACGI